VTLRNGCEILTTVIAQNEERNISRVNESLRCYDEILVVDSGPDFFLPRFRGDFAAGNTGGLVHRSRIGAGGIKMTSVEKLLSISSESLAPEPTVFPDFLQAYALGSELFAMLRQKNGFYAFESALHVLPLTADPKAGLEGWNAKTSWRDEYGDLAEGLLFFAEDVLQDQFYLSIKQGGVLRFGAETGAIKPMADSLESWAQAVLSEFKMETGWPLAHKWQLEHGPLPLGTRLMPRVPFFLGGQHAVENLWAGSSLEGMHFKGDMALQTRDLAEGAQVNLRISPSHRSERAYSGGEVGMKY
jgi:hypothetical protein